MMGRCLVLLFFSALLIVSCRPDSLSDEALKAYALNPENGLKKDAVGGDLTVTLPYWPKELVILQQVGLGDQPAFDREAARLDSMDYFVLTLSKAGKSLDDYYSRDPLHAIEIAGYLSDGIAEDISINVDSKELAAEGVAFAQGLGTAGVSSILIVFKSNLIEQKINNFSVIFHNASFALGYYQFDFDVNDIKSIPHLKKT